MWNKYLPEINTSWFQQNIWAKARIFEFSISQDFTGLGLTAVAMFGFYPVIWI